MFALNERSSFDSIPDWLAEFRKHIPDSSVPIALAGNKKDLEDQRQVSTEEAKILAKANNMTYHETSAMLGGNEIDEIFTGLTRDVLASKESNE